MTMIESAPQPDARFRNIFENEFAYVRRSLRRCGIRESDVDDLAHDVFVAAYVNRGSFDDARPIKPWLFGIAFRIASHHKRRPGYRRESLSDDGGSGPHLPTQGNDPVEEREKRELVLAALDHLSDEQRAVFVMHDLDECSVKDIAELLNVPLFTVYSRLRAARADFASAARRLQLRGKA